MFRMNGLSPCLFLGTPHTVPRLSARRRQPTYTAAGVDTICQQQLCQECDAFMDAVECADEKEVSYT